MSEPVNSITFNQEKRKAAITSVSVFMAIAFFAGSGRVIKYFPGAKPGGLLLNASTASAASLIKDYNSEGDKSCYQTIAAIGIASIVSWGLAQSIKGRVSLPLKYNLTLGALFSGVACLCSKMFPKTYMELFELTEREKMLLKSVGSIDTDKGWRVPLGKNLIKACFCMQIGHDQFFSLCTGRLQGCPELCVSVRTNAPAFINDYFNENVRDSNAQSSWFKEIEQKGYTSNTAGTLPLLHYKIAAAASLKISQSNPTELQSLSSFYLSPDEQKFLWNLDKLSLYFMVLGPDLMSICGALQKSNSEVRLALTKWASVPTYDALIIVRNQISKNSLNERKGSFLKPFSDILNRLLQSYSNNFLIHVLKKHGSSIIPEGSLVQRIKEAFEAIQNRQKTITVRGQGQETSEIDPVVFLASIHESFLKELAAKSEDTADCHIMEIVVLIRDIEASLPFLKNQKS